MAIPLNPKGDRNEARRFILQALCLCNVEISKAVRIQNLWLGNCEDLDGASKEKLREILGVEVIVMDRSLDLSDRQNMAGNFSELDLLDLHNAGQDLYRQKKYKEALKCFDQAIMSDVKPPLTVFDNRAATHMKLGQHKAALRDGKQMIEQDKRNCTGYLRTGKILQLLEKPSTALDIYQLGLRRVLPSDTNTRLLQGLRDKLARQCAPPEAVDPLQVLPMEIVKMVISYMSFKQIVNMLRVSKSWRELLSSMPKLWTNLDFSLSNGTLRPVRSVTLNAVRQYVRNSQGTCLAIRFDQFGQYQQTILGYVASRCKELREVKLLSGFVGASLLKAASCAANLRTLIVSSHCEISSDTVSQLLEQCDNLERAEFYEVKASRLNLQKSDMTKLHTLVLNAKEGLPALVDVPGLLAKMTEIRTLTLRNWQIRPASDLLDLTNSSNLECLDISHAVAPLPPKLPKSVRSLDMTKCTNKRYNSVPLPTYEPPTFPDLSSLSIGNTSIYSLLHLMDVLATNKGQLRQLDISAGSFSKQELIMMISGGYLIGIENLKLKQSATDDEVAILLARNLPQLREVDLACTRVTGVGVKTLVTELEGKLEWLGLDECRHTSVDAVEWARMMGVRTSYSFPDKQGKPRKVRSQFY